MRPIKSVTSASLNPFANDNIGTRCRTLENFPDGFAPTRADGDCADSNSGNANSSSPERRRSAS